MRFVIDLRQCQDHGQCAFTSAAFPLDPRGRLALRDGAGDQYVSDDLPESMRDELDEAVFSCPSQAIELTNG